MKKLIILLSLVTVWNISYSSTSEGAQGHPLGTNGAENKRLVQMAKEQQENIRKSIELANEQHKHAIENLAEQQEIYRDQLTKLNNNPEQTYQEMVSKLPEQARQLMTLEKLKLSREEKLREIESNITQAQAAHKKVIDHLQENYQMWSNIAGNNQ